MFLFHKLSKKSQVWQPSRCVSSTTRRATLRRQCLDSATGDLALLFHSAELHSERLLSPGSVHLQDEYLQRKKKQEQAGLMKMMLVHGQERNTFWVCAQGNTTRLFNVCVLDGFKPNGDRKWRSQSKAAECVNRQDLQRSPIYTDNGSSPQW